MPLGNGPLTYLTTVGPDKTKFVDITTTDVGPWTYEVLSLTADGKSPLTSSNAVVPIGGPDVTAHRQAIAADFNRQWAKMRFLQQLAFSSDFSTEMNFPSTLANNFDIQPLADHVVQTPINDGILNTSGGDQGVTVTVDGHVYLQVEVDYFLYGLIFSKIHTFSPFTAYASGYVNVELYRFGEWQRGNGFNLTGRDAWFLAGYENDFDYAIPAAIRGVAPAPRPNLTTVPDIYPMHWFAGELNNPQMIGND
jgi:hypothetical protein